MQLAVIAAFAVSGASALNVRSNVTAAVDGCSSKNVGAMAMLSLKSSEMGVECEEMCKRIGSYPDCQCAGFNGQPASDGDTRACHTKYCQDPTAPCPNDGFVGCVKEATAVLLQWDSVFARFNQGLDSLKGTMEMRKKLASTQKACDAKKQIGFSALLEAKAQQMGVVCEEMCKRVGSYPDCQCSGFGGNPASDGDTRACVVKYCQDPKFPCPTDAFTACVKENTAVLMQWDSVFAKVSSGLDSLTQAMKMRKNTTK